jgi:hypothetical protein
VLGNPSFQYISMLDIIEKLLSNSAGIAVIIYH